MEFDDRKYLIEMGGSAVASAGPDSLYDIQCYFEAMEAFLASTAGERQLRLRAMRDRIDSGISDFLTKAENEMLWDDYFPSELRASVLVSAMSFLERYLNGVCAEAAILLRKPIGHTKIRGSAIERARTYLSELCALRGPSHDRWESIRALQSLRNVLIHNGGTFELPKELKRIESLTKNLEGVSCHEHGIDLEDKFIRFALGEISLFLDEMKRAFADICEDVIGLKGRPKISPHGCYWSIADPPSISRVQAPRPAEPGAPARNSHPVAAAGQAAGPDTRFGIHRAAANGPPGLIVLASEMYAPNSEKSLALNLRF